MTDPKAEPQEPQQSEPEPEPEIHSMPDFTKAVGRFLQETEDLAEYKKEVAMFTKEKRAEISGRSQGCQQLETRLKQFMKQQNKTKVEVGQDKMLEIIEKETVSQPPLKTRFEIALGFVAESDMPALERAIESQSKASVSSRLRAVKLQKTLKTKKVIIK